MAKIPYPHLHPIPFRKLWAMGPPIQVVMIYGDEATPNMKALFFKWEVSAMKMLSV